MALGRYMLLMQTYECNFFFRYNLSVLGVIQDRMNAHRAPN